MQPTDQVKAGQCTVFKVESSWDVKCETRIVSRAAGVFNLGLDLGSTMFNDRPRSPFPDLSKICYVRIE